MELVIIDPTQTSLLHSAANMSVQQFGHGVNSFIKSRGECMDSWHVRNTERHNLFVNDMYILINDQDHSLEILMSLLDYYGLNLDMH